MAEGQPRIRWQGLLSRVARDIDFDDRDGRGQWMGFFNYLEIMMLLGADRVGSTAMSIANISSIWR